MDDIKKIKDGLNTVGFTMRTASSRGAEGIPPQVIDKIVEGVLALADRLATIEQRIAALEMQD